MRRVTALMLAILFAACAGNTTTETASEETTTTTLAPTTSTVATTTSSTTTTTTTTLIPTTTTTFNVQEATEEIRGHLIGAVEELPGMERVESIEMGNGGLSIVARTQWASEDRQASQQVAIIEMLALTISGTESHTREIVFGSISPIFMISTTSTDGDYPIVTVTDFAQLVEIAERRLTSSDWLAATRQ